MMFILAFMISAYVVGQGFVTAQFAQNNRPLSDCRDYSRKLSNFSGRMIFRLH